MYKSLLPRHGEEDPERKSRPVLRDGSTSPNKPTMTSKLNIAVILLAYCVSGTALTLVNKVVIGKFPFPNTLLAIQNAIAVAVIVTGSFAAPATFGKLPELNQQTLREWTPIVVLFVAILLSSLLSLMKVSAVTLIVIRNLISCTVAFFEFVVLKTKIAPRSALSLAGILGGALMYALHDITFDALGYAWLLVNVVATTAYQILVKRVIASQTSKSSGPLGYSFVNNTLSTPLLAVLCLASGEGRRLVDGVSLGATSGVVLATVTLSGVLGICLSLTGFMLNERISATSIMVANNVNKVGCLCVWRG
jgi:hypothetical protein